jgi:hypothetical protein
MVLNIIRIIHTEEGSFDKRECDAYGYYFDVC